MRELVAPDGLLKRALDVGCGTGLSSVALLDLAQAVVGLDASLPMLRHARAAERVRYVAASAEALPFRDGRFDLVLACGSIDWVDRARFLPRAAELLVTGGFLVSLDFGDTGRSAELPALARWYEEVFGEKFPRPPASDPIVTADEAARHGFGAPVERDFATTCRFSPREYAEFLMTESNVIAAIEYGDETEGRVLEWLESELAALFGGAPRRVAFAGYIQALQRL